MGLLRFIVAPPNRITEEMAQQAYLTGLDRIPWRIRTRIERGELWLERTGSDSGNLHVPWPVEGHGELMLSSSTLRERADPYHLPLELARGKITQVRNQLADWQTIGMEIPEAAERRLHEAIGHFGAAVCIDHDSPSSGASAEQALAAALEAGNLLTASYAEQVLAVRRRATGRLPTFLGAGLGGSPLEEFPAAQFLQTFNAAVVPMVWREVETGEEEYFWDVCDRQIQWCKANGLAVCAGPLLRFDERAIPDWLHVCDGDFDGVLSFAMEFIQAAVDRYRGQVDFWQCAGRVNNAEILSLSEEEVVRLTARAVELTRSRDPNAQIVVSFDQPWGEYLSRQTRDFPPLQFADALLRAGLGLTAIALEMNVGYRPGGSAPRDLLELNQELDYWGLLGVPLLLMVTVPSGTGPDPLAQRKASLPPGPWTPVGQQLWVDRHVPLMLAKALVQGVFWNQLRDSEPHLFPHGGLFDLRRHPKPALRHLASLRQGHLR